MNLISLVEVSKHYQMGGETVKALDSITIHISENDYIAFIGSSGSGKSTMLNALTFRNLAGLEVEGEIRAGRARNRSGN